MDGMTGASAAAVCMLFAVTVNETNWDLLPVAFAGIAGDRQDIGGLSGLNSWLMEEGSSRGFAETRRKSLVPRGPLSQMTSRFDPYIKGVSGSPGGTESILTEIGVSPDTRGDDLDEGDRRKLQSLLSLRLLEQGVGESTLMEHSREVPFFPAWGMEAGEMASLLNACGRMGEEGNGLALTLGDEDAVVRAK
jgi:RecJ-like exonuclease